MKILYDSHNYSIIKNRNQIVLFSFQVPIANYNIRSNNYYIDKNLTLTQTDKMHIKNFKKFIETY
jgi:hypothetical protein